MKSEMGGERGVEPQLKAGGVSSVVCSRSANASPGCLMLSIARDTEMGQTHVLPSRSLQSPDPDRHCPGCQGVLGGRATPDERGTDCLGSQGGHHRIGDVELAP